MSLFIGGKTPLIKSIQRGTITITGAASVTATITSVNTASAVVRMVGFTTSGTLTDYQTFPRVELTNATTVTASVNTSPGANSVVVSYEVIEYDPTYVKSLQRGTIALAGSSSKTATITAVDTTHTELIDCGFTTSNSGASTSTVNTDMVLTNSTTITATSVGTGANQTVGYQVLEWNP